MTFVGPFALCSRRFHSALPFFGKTDSSNLHNLLLSMPKYTPHREIIKGKQIKMKDKIQKYSPGTVTLQVLGSGAKGAPRCLYVFTDQSRYLFNCGEGTQRLAHEHKMKLSKLEHIFLTYPSWENLGGLPGVALTIQDVGVPLITLHGPQGSDEIFTATRRFVVLKNLSIRRAECKDLDMFEDSALRVVYVPLVSNKVPSPRQQATSLDRSPRQDGEEDDIDYYAHERGSSSPPRKKRRRSSSAQPEPLGRRGGVGVAMSYICRVTPRAGALLLDKCVEAGVTPGPLLGELKAGNDVTLPNGQIVRSCDVTQPPDPGPVFIVVEVPSEDYLGSLETSKAFLKHQASASKEEDVAFLVVHFSPPRIMDHPTYRKWMSRFAASTQHLILNESNSCLGSVAVHRIQHKLHLLEPSLFPLLASPPIKTTECELMSNGMSNSVTSMGSWSGVMGSNCGKLSHEFAVVPGDTLTSLYLRPRKLPPGESQLSISPEEYISETMSVTGFPEELGKLKESLSKLRKPTTTSEYPSLVFLGTGSCIPSKTRNTSSILLNLSEEKSMLLDCGEGTYGQLVRYYGPSLSEIAVARIKAVYVSHLHADHHMGLVGLLKARRRACLSDTLYLLAPAQIMTWLNIYDKTFEPILGKLCLVPNAGLMVEECLETRVQTGVYEEMLKELGLSSVSTTRVKHCPNSFGLSVTHAATKTKITYSGDTLPCESLVKLGKDSDILIHEATMEDELKDEAIRKLHSTTSQAIAAGKAMNARFTILTHFSQRYAKLPRLNEEFPPTVGIAFDNMHVRLNDLPKLKLLYPALRLMFQEQCEELENKAMRRQLKQERDASKAVQ